MTGFQCTKCESGWRSVPSKEIDETTIVEFRCDRGHFGSVYVHGFRRFGMDVFVYGTLTDPECAQQILTDDRFEHAGSAVLDGLHRVDGRYPTLVPGGRVRGRILRIGMDAIDALDAYEGVDRGLYLRTSVPIDEHRHLLTQPLPRLWSWQDTYELRPRIRTASATAEPHRRRDTGRIEENIPPVDVLSFGPNFARSTDGLN